MHRFLSLSRRTTQERLKPTVLQLFTFLPRSRAYAFCKLLQWLNRLFGTKILMKFNGLSCLER
jgi:hypothetical protein